MQEEDTLQSVVSLSRRHGFQGHDFRGIDPVQRWRSSFLTARETLKRFCFLGFIFIFFYFCRKF